MKNEDVAEAFSRGIYYIRTQHLFCDEKTKTIYSYGYHYPIATDKGDYYIFNNSPNSMTTAKHKGIVYREISQTWKPIIKIEEAKPENAKKQIEINKEEIQELKEKLKRARKEHRKQAIKEQIKELEQKNKLIKTKILGDEIAEIIIKANE